MLTAIRVHRTARRLMKAFPEIGPDVARDRARRFYRTWRYTSTASASEYLISGESMARRFEYDTKR